MVKSPFFPPPFFFVLTATSSKDNRNKDMDSPSRDTGSLSRADVRHVLAFPFSFCPKNSLSFPDPPQQRKDFVFVCVYFCN
jgi:hypothetical protein